MPITEVPSSPPPNAEQTPDPSPGLPPRRNTSDYGDLGTDELVQRISELEDERRHARIREGIWIALLLHSIVVLLWIFGPHYIWHEPVVVTPKLKSSETLTYLPPRSTPHPAPIHPSIDSKTLQRLQAMRQSAPPTPQPPQQKTAPQQTTPQPTQQAQATTPPPPAQAPPPPQQVAPQPVQRPQPETTPQLTQPQATPPPTQTAKNPFQTPSSAGDMIRQATRGASGGSSSGATESAPRGAGGMGIPGPDILSDTLGYDFDPYLRRVIAATYAAWLPIIPESARPPLSNRGKVFIDFTIMPDGSLAVGKMKMQLRGSSSDVSLDRAAWGGITGAAYPPLPKDFKGQFLTLRFGFYYNIKPEDEK